MVVRLDRPTFLEEDLIDKVVSQRQGGKNNSYFNRIKNEWKLKVKDYLDAGGNPEFIKPWAEVATFKTRFLTLYSSPQEHSVQKPILEKLRERTLQICPACGEDGTPNTLDHYLPKNAFPEFSITTANLFPMCDICQGEKLEKTLSRADERLFLHPYFDNFLDKQIVKLAIMGPYKAPGLIALFANPNLPIDARALVTRHLRELNIVARYSHFFREQYIHLLGSANDIREFGLNVREQIELFRRKSERKSINSWAHVFYDSVLSNDSLIEYLSTADLPAI